MKRKQVNNANNLKDDEGLWVKSYTVSNVRHQTRSAILWNNINIRCKPDGGHQKRRPTYIGTTNDFESFNTFTDWCEDSYGLYEKEFSGEYWALDKDILVPGDMSYNPQACLFVPKDVNILFQNRSKTNNLPRGVIKRPVDTEFPYTVSYNNLYMGARTSKSFTNEQDAHRFWQENKIISVKNALKLDILSEHTVLLRALEYRLSLLEYDYENFIETKTI